jgi:hypothetical protein
MCSGWAEAVGLSDTHHLHLLYALSSGRRVYFCGNQHALPFLATQTTHEPLCYSPWTLQAFMRAPDRPPAAASQKSVLWGPSTQSATLTIAMSTYPLLDDNSQTRAQQFILTERA